MTRMSEDEVVSRRWTTIRRRIIMRGVVQGVGFRPHLATLAARFPITGFTGNNDESVFAEAEGEAWAVDGFIECASSDHPPLAVVTSLEDEELIPTGEEIAFVIIPSRRSPGALTLISPDIAPCADCVREMTDPSDRRFRYPFITCTNCGPRLSIIRDVPYDRPNTTMDAFPMCDACAAEYSDPSDRRYHAQPISCFDCGPTLRLTLTDLGREAGFTTPHAGGSSRSRESFDAILTAARAIIADGGILAVKGIGGYTLMCDARDANAVERLRSRKRRPGKPFAVMAATVEAAERIADLSPAQRDTLVSPQRPIVLLPQAATYDLAPGVAPGLDDVGVMLPSAPLHVLLVEGDEVLVATSGNVSGDPIRYRDDEAERDLARLVDGFLVHDREIVTPVEDSVSMADTRGGRGTLPALLSAARCPDIAPSSPLSSHHSRPSSEHGFDDVDLIPVRRSRGYAPLPVHLGGADVTVLAVGGELKNTFAVTRHGMAFLSAHIGDMGSLRSRQAFERGVDQSLRSHRRSPALLVCDLHPGYATTAWAERYSETHDIHLLRVQHHHAHALSLVAEHRLQGKPTVVATLDGTGYGTDGTIWGGEIIALGADPLEYERVWHLPMFPLAGGDSAVKRVWKSALGLLARFGVDPAGLPCYEEADPAERALVLSQLATGPVSGLAAGVVETSSAGRWFDAVASILGVRQEATYEAQAAMELERAAHGCHHAACADPGWGDPAGIVAAVVEGARSGRSIACMARGFHAALATVVVDALADYATAHPEIEGRVGLSGGVFANRLLTRDCQHRWGERASGALLIHHVVPANDGGLSLGQALAGVLTMNRPGQFYSGTTTTSNVTNEGGS
ncbi:MAG: carbamoyltransferase HypF [Propionibacteriaceae bacterium]|jgi:hydrogenase maturation protein HypF|nr:carbamoyltransferase HypF [Propionibacteriaceae bacterium]